MAKKLTLKRDAICTDCGAELPAGTVAMYYGPKNIYGLTCHPRKQRGKSHYSQPRPLSDEEMESWSKAKIASHYDPTGFYNANGECIGRTNPKGRCEDAPCCGCCS